MTSPMGAENTALRKRLIKARQVASLTQIEVAKRLSVPQSFVSKYENGERRLDVLDLLRVVRALDADPIAFISELDQEIQTLDDLSHS